MEQTNSVFDADLVIALQLRAPQGMKVVRVRFPSDAEWIERQRRRKIIIKNRGRGVSETTIPNREEVDAALLVKIRAEDSDGAADVDPFEAVKCVDQLAQAKIDDVTPEGDVYRVSLRVLGGTTVHLIRVPSAKDVFDYQRAFVRMLDLPYDRQELTINLRAAAELYAKLAQATEGYVGAVPIIHQAEAVRAVVEAVDAFVQDEGNADF